MELPTDLTMVFEFLDGAVAGLFSMSQGKDREGVFIAGDDVVDNGQDLLAAVALPKEKSTNLGEHPPGTVTE